MLTTHSLSGRIFFVARELIEMQALGNDVFEPTVSLSRHKKEFGEFGGVNASIESSTTFTGSCVCYLA